MPDQLHVDVVEAPPPAHSPSDHDNIYVHHADHDIHTNRYRLHHNTTAPQHTGAADAGVPDGNKDDDAGQLRGDPLPSAQLRVAGDPQYSVRLRRAADSPVRAGMPDRMPVGMSHPDEHYLGSLRDRHETVVVAVLDVEDAGR